MTLNELSESAHKNAVAHGFYETPPSIPERLALIHSEVSEALEDYRDGNMAPAFRADGKPIGFPSELADIIIRVADLAGCEKIDLDEALKIKMAYNEKRPYKHGQKVL